MACGVAVVSGKDCHPQDVDGFASVMGRHVGRNFRDVAERLFQPERAAKAMLSIARSVMVPA